MAAPRPMRSMFNHFKVFSGTANLQLAREICDALGCPLGALMIKTFADGETHLQIQENVRGADVFVVQPTCTPVDHHLMEILLMMDALKRASAERITAVLPYYGYARQDRKDKPRMPISAKLVASLIETGGRRPGVGRGPARGADPGFLRHSCGSSVRCAGDGRVL